MKEFTFDATRSVTIRDVAHHAQVSVKTVSRVINDEPRVTEATRAKVLAGMEQLGYVPNISAQRLARGRAHILALIFPRETGHYLNKIAHHILVAGHEAGYEVVLRPSEVNSAKGRSEILKLVTQRQADGLIFVAPCDRAPELFAELARLRCPAVRLSPSTNSGDSPAIAVDNRHGTRVITTHLLDLGHRRIGFVRGPMEHQSSHDRLEGFQQTLRAQGIVLDEALLQPGDYGFASGHAAGHALLELPRPPTAILASNDDMAAGVLMAAHERGVRVPDALSVTGFDNVELARQVWPPLTTMHPPTDDVARLAVDLLVRLLQGEPVDQTHYTFQSKLILRGSTGPPRDENKR